MRRKQIQIALEAAAKLSNHQEFVIAGSLSVLGYVDTPPEMMSLSIDIDFFPLRDPGRAAEIAAELGEDSDFHERNGYYLDPISPELPVLPKGWRERLVYRPLGSITACFLDVNDTAISKYARSAENDFRWLDAGHEAKILDIETIAARARFDTDYPTDEDKHNIQNGIEAHRAAIRNDGTLASGLLEFVRSVPDKKIEKPDTDDSVYAGPIIWIGEGRAIQSLGPNSIIIHTLDETRQSVQVGQRYTILYQQGSLEIRQE